MPDLGPITPFLLPSLLFVFITCKVLYEELPFALISPFPYCQLLGALCKVLGCQQDREALALKELQAET